MTAIDRLRAATGPDHDAVDAAFGRFDLTDRGDYAAFLTAHARALPAVESALERFDALPTPPHRREALAGDLAVLGMAEPEALPFALADADTAWGALYVAEGSRLGGIMLAGRVGVGLPSAYLSARHEKGAWRALLAAIDAAVTTPDAIDRAVAGARSTFALYAQAAGQSAPSASPRSAR